jgi:hypothetical protein
MEDFFLKFDLGKSTFSITHDSKMLFLGSCFSEEIAELACYNGFHSSSNPFGTIFHPLPIARFVIESISGLDKERILESNGRFYSWDASTRVNKKTIEEIELELDTIRKQWREKLIKASVLFVTFGSAWGYHLRESMVVANCHKQSSSLFRKELTETNLIVEAWIEVLELLRIINPELNVVFTVSPVRHIRDGLIENNQSKAILIDAVRRINLTTKSFYFPSYEILIDQLRDYRFYKTDRVHPSDEAVNVVWNKLLKFYSNDLTRSIAAEVRSYRKFESHIPKGNEESVLLDYKNRRESMRQDLTRKYPCINL